MKTKKLSFGNIKHELSRDELKNIMAGSGSGCNPELCIGCRTYAPGDPPCYEFKCHDSGACAPVESTCCIV